MKGNNDIVNILGASLVLVGFLFIIFIIVMFIRDVTSDNTKEVSKIEKIEKKEIKKEIPKCEIELDKCRNTCKILREKPTNIYINQGINPKHIRGIICSVLEYLEIKNVYDWERLLYLTLVVESDGGFYTKQLGKGPAKGIYQLEPQTEKDILKWLRVKHKALYDKIRRLRVPINLGIHEAEYNLAYATAMAYMEYFRRGVNPKNASTEDLARLHKIHYNTYLGKASVEKTLKKLALLKIKL